MENSTSLALQKKKTKKLIVLIVVGALSLTLIAAGILFVLVSKTIKIPPRSVGFFSDVSSFEGLEQYVEKDLDVKGDGQLQGLSPKQCWLKPVKYKGHTYIVSAYVFEDERSAELYFSNNPELYLKREGMYRLEKVSLIQTEFFAYYKNCAYRVVGVWAVPTCGFIKYISEMMPITAADVNVKGY